MEADVKALRTQVQSQNFEIDRLEQYSRRENIRVFGVAETADELTNDITGCIVKVAADMGVAITERDISVSHRIGKKTGTKRRPIIAKFVRRDTKTAIMRNKRNLKGLDSYKSVFVNDDLTTMRSKLVYELKRDGSVTRVWTMNGKIMCVQGRFRWLPLMSRGTAENSVVSPGSSLGIPWSYSWGRWEY